MTVPTHLISSTSTLLSLHFHHSNDSLHVCVCVLWQPGVCVFPSACVTLFMCLCIKHVDVSDCAAPK